MPGPPCVQVHPWVAPDEGTLLTVVNSFSFVQPDGTFRHVNLRLTRPGYVDLWYQVLVLSTYTYGDLWQTDRA